MPFVSIKVIKGALSEEKKKAMIERVSDVVAEIEAAPEPKERMKPYVWCVIEEIDEGAWGVGGAPVTLDMLAALIKGG
jgi:4-oxalocrotonate tautomerase